MTLHHLYDIHSWQRLVISLDGGTQQQRGWVTEAINEAAVDYPFGIFPQSSDVPLADRVTTHRVYDDETEGFPSPAYPPSLSPVTFRWEAEPPCGGEDEFACTQHFPHIADVQREHWIITIRDDLDDPSRPEPYSGEAFYKDVVLHEMGHVILALIMDRLGESVAKSLICGLFDAPLSAWDSGTWGGQVKEAFAETFKDMVYAERTMDNRTQWRLPARNWEAWKDVSIDAVLAAPTGRGFFETARKNPAAFHTPRIGDNPVGSIDPTRFHSVDGIPEEPIPGDVYEINSRFKDGEVIPKADDEDQTGSTIPSRYTYWQDSDLRRFLVSGDTHLHWLHPAARTSINAERRLYCPPDPGDELTLGLYVMNAPGVWPSNVGPQPWSAFVATDFTITAEWYVVDSIEELPTSKAEAFHLETFEVTNDSPTTNELVYTAPAYSLGETQLLVLAFTSEGMFPTFAVGFNSELPWQISWRYRGPAETAPGWYDPPWPYGGEIASAGADAGTVRLGSVRVAGGGPIRPPRALGATAGVALPSIEAADTTPGSHRR